MSFNKNSPNPMGKIMDYLKQLSTEMGGSEPVRHGQSEKEEPRRGPKYARAPSRATLSASSTCTSLATTYGSQEPLAQVAHHYAAIPEQATTESSSEDEQVSFNKSRRPFQQLRQISLGNGFKYKVETEIKIAKDENSLNSVPFVKQLSLDSNTVETDYTIKGEPPYGHSRRIYLWTQGGSEQVRRGQSDEEPLYKLRGPKYARVVSRTTLSASTTCTSLATTYGSQGTLAQVAHHYAAIPEQATTGTSKEDEQVSFNKRLRRFQQLRQISLGKGLKYKVETEIKSAKDENLLKSVPFVKQLSLDSNKVKTDYTINGEPPYAHSRPIYLWTQLVAAFSVSMGSLIVGFSSGYTSPAFHTMNATLSVTETQKSWIGGLMPLAALVGGIAGGAMIEMFGRKLTIMGTALPFFIGWMLIANAFNVSMVLAGRALCGICVGVGSLSFPIYLGETIQPEVRGALGLLPTAFGNTGILLTYLAGAYLTWSQLAFLGAALPVPFFLLMFLTPETPRWYVTKNRPADAHKALQWLRGKNFNIDMEMRDLIRTQVEADRAGGSGLGLLFSKKYLPAVMISLGLMLFQQFSGINAVVFYASDIFEKSGTGKSIDESWSTIIIGIVNFISTFIATAIIERLGRKILLYISSVAMIITLVTLGGFFYALESGADVSSIGWLPLASLVIYVLGFSIGFGPIPWLMLGEILPLKIRGMAASVATSFNWTCTFIVTTSFKSIDAAINMSGTVWLFAVICVAGLLFVIVFVPETQGKTLEEIERILTGGSQKVRSASASRHKQNGC